MKKIMFLLLAFVWFSNFADASLLEEVSCSKYWTSANSCDQCFDGWHVYEGRWKTIYDVFNNDWNTKLVYFDDENSKVYETRVLQNTTTWFTSNNLLKYSDNFNWYTSNSRWLYHIFEPKTSTKFLETRTNKGFRLDEVRDWTNRNDPAYMFKFIANYRSYNWTLWAKQEHVECAFYNPAFCWDWVVDSWSWEQCDDWNNDNTDSCNSSCQIVTPQSYDLALDKKVSWNTTTFYKWDSVTFNITVYNQWNVNANNIVVTDYIPNWLTLNDSSWSLSWNNATRNIGSIAAGWQKTVNITFTITGNSGEIINWAEISSDDGNDIDSTPDSNNNNDCHWWDDRNSIDSNSDDRISWVW